MANDMFQPARLYLYMNDIARENDKQSGNINKAIAKCSRTRYKLYEYKNVHTAQIFVA